MEHRIATNVEQSRKLVKLGIDVNTADMFWLVIGDSGRLHVLTEDLSNYRHWDNCPSWSLSALLELIPESIDEYTDSFSQLEITKKSVSYVYANGMLRKGFLKDNLLDAAFEMVSYLLEHDLIK